MRSLDQDDGLVTAPSSISTRTWCNFSKICAPVRVPICAPAQKFATKKYNKINVVKLKRCISTAPNSPILVMGPKSLRIAGTCSRPPTTKGATSGHPHASTHPSKKQRLVLPKGHPSGCAGCLPTGLSSSTRRALSSRHRQISRRGLSTGPAAVQPPYIGIHQTGGGPDNLGRFEEPFEQHAFEWTRYRWLGGDNHACLVKELRRRYRAPRRSAYRLARPVEPRSVPRTRY